MSERLDVIGIGNAMVDAIIPTNKKEVEKHQINRNSMNLIDEELKNKDINLLKMELFLIKLLVLHL